MENIHQKVLEAVTEKGELYMSSWHEDEEINEEGAHCGTTHCRAGWVVALAGKEGRWLESITDTPFAAMQILLKSSPIRVPLGQFHVDNETAMADIKRCAEEEVKLNQSRVN